MTDSPVPPENYEKYEADWAKADVPERFDMDAHVKSSWRWYREELKSPRHILAPMVDASDLPWRVLSRRYGTDLCYTPMFHASNFVRDNTYRRENFPIDGEVTQGSLDYDRPLFVQFCANDKDVFAKAAEMVKDRCDAVDLNLGCPQMIAKRGHYGSHMQEDWSLIRSMIEEARKRSDVRITVKIRRFEDDNTTIRYAKMLEKSGASILTIHGRTRDQRGPNTGLADWEIIKKVKEAIRIPVFANGNIQCLTHVRDCIERTGVDGVMTAEGNLYNPAIFAGLSPASGEIVQEFVDIAGQYKYPTFSSVRGHLFKMFHHVFLEDAFRDQRDKLAVANTYEDIIDIARTMRERLGKYDTEELNSPIDMTGLLALPFWRCKPYVRPKRDAEKPARKRPAETIEQRNRRKEAKALKVAKFHEKALNKELSTKYPVCTKCPCNPRGMKCLFELCRSCCKYRVNKEDVDCVGHKLYGITSREKRRKLQEEYKECSEKSEKVERSI